LANITQFKESFNHRGHRVLREKYYSKRKEYKENGGHGPPYANALAPAYDFEF